jgi:hypothetical protein
MKNTRIELVVDGKRKFVFPVTPSEFTNPFSMNNEKVSINGLGEILLKGDRNLSSLGWSSFFPADDYEFLQVKKREKPKRYIEILENLAKQKKTVTINITSLISMNCVIDSFEPGMEERGKDVSYSITFVEYRDVDTPSVKKQTAKRPTKNTYSHLYTWKKGDTWKKVAKKETGKAENWQKLRKANLKRIDKAAMAYSKAHTSGNNQGQSNTVTAKESTFLVGVKVLIK